MKKVIIYTDGACSGNPGAGGYAAVLMYKDKEKVVKGYDKITTNNRMELTAIIEGLKALKEPCEVTIYSDSAYAVNPFKKDWITSWISSGWKTLGKSDVQNVDLWQELVQLVNKHKVNFVKVKGHSDNIYNNKCDEIARGEIKVAQNT